MEVRDNNGRYLRKSKDLTGNRYFRLVAIRLAKREGDPHAYWECKCDCGNIVVVRKDSLESGHAKSCGCYLQERYKDGHLRIHNSEETKLYKAWQGIKQRCCNPKSREYKNYGGRGIAVCPEWLNNYDVFRKWSLENGFDKSVKGHKQSIDRINVNGNYEPSNCRWTDLTTQNYNKRCTVRVDVYGENLTLKEISEKYMIPISKVRGRYHKYKKGKITLGKLLGRE